VTRRLVVGAGLCVTLLASCTTGHHRATATSRPAPLIVETFTTAPIPTSVRASRVVSRCPARLPVAPANGGVPRIDLVLVPIAAIRVDVCEYAGSARSPALGGQVVFGGGASALSIEDAVNVLPATDPLTGTTCAPNPDSGILLVFGDGFHVEEVRAAVSRCRAISNGYLRSPPTAYWTAVLRRLVATADQCARSFGVASGCSAGSG
jgi:hypothetical protein